MIVTASNRPHRWSRAIDHKVALEVVFQPIHFSRLFQQEVGHAIIFSG
jgi:hypothetical protein